MGAVVGSVAIVEAGGPAAAPAPPAATSSPTTAAATVGPPASMSFADDAPAADRASAILDEVMGGDGDPAADTDKPAEPAKAEGDKPAETTPEPAAAPPTDIEAAKLRKGFAKLADERQKLVELQNSARTAIEGAQQYAAKAQKHDEIVSALQKDPAAFLHAHGGEELVQKALQGFIDMEKSPAEREVAALRAERDADKRADLQRQQEQVAAQWRNDIAAKVQADERFDLVNSLGLHGEVIDIITGYYDKHSERDTKGNVTKPAILPWEAAAQAVEDHRAAMVEKSKRYGKRTPAAAAPETVPAKKDAPPAKQQPAPAKKAPTSLSSVPVADSPHSEDDLPTDDLDERERRILAELGAA